MKKYFKNNKQKKNYTSVAIFVLVILLISGMLFSSTYKKTFQTISSKISQFATVLSSALVLQTNNFRESNNERDLIVSDLLTKAAQMKADDMAVKGYFSHVGPNGEEPWFWFKKAGYVFSYAGENLAVDYTESSDVTTGWINSAKHKANILNNNFTEVGIGLADGIFEGRKTTFVVQFFAKPYKAEVSKPVIVENNTVATVKEAQVTAVKPVATTTMTAIVAEAKPTQQLASTSPEIAVVTKIGVPEGEVLGIETNNIGPADSSNQIKWLVIIGVSLLVLIAVILKVYIVRKKE
jgi:uncharacterized protein YkwD